MKLLMESWRRYLNESGFGEGTPPTGEFYKKQIKYLEEDSQTKPKVIFMAGAPGVGKGHVRKQLGLDINPDFKHEEKDEETGETKVISHIVDPDQFYVPMLKKELPPLGVPEEDAANIEKLTTQYVDARRALKKLLAQTLNLTEPEDGWTTDVLEDMYEQAYNDSKDNLVLVHNLEKTKKEYDTARNICSVQGTCFSTGQAEAKNLQQELFDEKRSIIIDGTAGYYPRIINQKEAFESAGYDVAMIFVDAPLETALGAQKDRERRLNPYDVEKSMKTLLGGTYFDRKKGEQVTKPNIMKPFVNYYGKPKKGYEKEFGDNYFHIINDRINTDENIAQIKPKFDRFLNTAISEDFQQDVKRQHKKMKIRLIGKGGNKTKAAPYFKNPSMKRSKSAPPGFGGS